MEMPPKKKLNGSDNDSNWSTLSPDLIRSILERLDFLDFHRARCVSSNWYSSSESCIIQNPTPWLIFFSNDSHISCKLYDPHHDKTYTIRDVGLDFHRSRCLATSGSWFLMLDHRTDFYILNLFTRERIPLPTLEAIDGTLIKFERDGESDDLLETVTYEGSSGKKMKTIIQDVILSVNERSRDYLVVWSRNGFFAYYKKGNNNKSWKVFQPSNYRGCIDMVLRESKLYVLTQTENIIVFDFSGDDSPKECASFASPDNHTLYQRPSSFSYLVVTLSGDVLAIAYGLVTWSLDVYKIYPKSSKWEHIHSIGNETMFFDLGTTVATKDGFMKNCVYVSSKSHKGNSWVYNIGSRLIVQEFQHLVASSSIPFKDARWFLPTFGSKCLR